MKNKIIYNKYLDSDLRSQTYVKFSKDESVVFFAEEENINIVDTTNFSSYRIPIKGKVLSISEMPELKINFILSKLDNIYTVTIIENPSYKIGEFSFEATNASVITVGNQLYVGRDITISKFEVIKWKKITHLCF